MTDCIFCKIVNREIPAHVIYEDDNFMAFLDVRPLNLGHILVIPKKHYRWVWDIDNVGEYYEVVAKIAKAMKKVLNTEYVVSLVFGEEVHHAHVWLVPRYDDDGHGGAIDLDNIKDISEEEMNIVTEKIKKAL